LIPSMTRPRFLQYLILLVISVTSGVASADYREIGNQELQDLLQRDVDIIDVRRSDEWLETGIIPNSRLATFFDRFGRFDAESWMKQIDGQQYRDKPVILICHSGVRSRVIGRWMSSVLGYDSVYNVQKGIVHWQRKGHHTTGWSPPAQSAEE